MIELESIEQAERLINESTKQPVLLFKHSTRCGTSAYAHGQVNGFRSDHPGLSLAYARVLVVENRPVSLWIAERLGVPHASPQIMLIVDGKVVWHASHYAIGERNIEHAVESVAAKGA